ncbi:MAG: chromosome partitioning protein ParB [Blastopirellula sp.]|nr:MAG: chromosome partitioning protein ParB [Blastopirellula sp.]
MTDGSVVSAFEKQLMQLQVKQVLPTKVIEDDILKSSKYKQIRSSIREVGIIEPLVVRVDSKSFILLDGHMRLEALKDLSINDVTCLIAKDDETFTYNKHINRIAPIQEHRMIIQAVKRGVPEEKIARALNMDVKSIISKQKLLNGICQEVADTLKDKVVAVGMFSILRKMKHFRQIKAISLMSDANVYTIPYARALLAATPNEQLTNPKKTKNIKGLNNRQISRMESEMASVEREYRLIEENYRPDVLNHTFAKGYLSSLLSNVRVVRYLAKHHSEVLTEFQNITQIE